MGPAALREVVGGQDLVGIPRPQQQLLLAQLHASTHSFCCEEQGRDGQGEAFAVRSLHSLREEGGKQSTALAGCRHRVYSPVLGFICSGAWLIPGALALTYWKYHVQLEVIMARVPAP